MRLRNTVGLAIAMVAAAGCAGGEVDAGGGTTGAGGASLSAGGASGVTGGNAGTSGGGKATGGSAGVAGASGKGGSSGTGGATTGGNGGSMSKGGSGGSSGGGTSAGGKAAGGTSAGGTSAGGKGGTSSGGTSAGGTSAGGKGGTSSGGTSAGGTSAGGTAAGGTAAGGTAAGGTAAGGTAAGGTAAGGTAAGGTAAGGTAAGGTAAGGTAAGGSSAGGSAGAAGGGFCAIEKAGDCVGLELVTVDNACAKFADAECGLLARCNLLSAAQAAACTADFTAACEAKSDLKKAVAAGRRSLDGAASACCLHHVRDLQACLGNNEGDPSCAGATTGLVPLAGDCFAKEDCASGVCDLSATCPGKCIAGVPLGAPCGTAAGIQCAAGLLCNGKSVCAPLACEGQPCKDDKCAGGLNCVTNPATMVKTCVKSPGLGDACTPEEITCDLETSSCDLMVTAGGITGTCAAQGDVGAPCYEVFNCKAGLYCEGASFQPPTKGTCTAQKTGACDPAVDNDSNACGFLSVCLETTSMCGPAPKVGDACVPAKDQCNKSYCDALTSTCAAKKPAGAVCAKSKECAGGGCNALVCGAGGEVACSEPLERRRSLVP